MADDGGLGSFQRRMAAIPKAARAAVQPVLMREAGVMADAMRGLAPVDEGDLRDSITVTGPGQSTPPYSQPGGSTVVPPNATAITVGSTDVRYAHLVEYGTGPRMASAGSQSGVHPGTPAQPFFWPAFRLHRKRAVAAIKREIGKAIKGAR